MLFGEGSRRGHAVPLLGGPCVGDFSRGLGGGGRGVKGRTLASLSSLRAAFEFSSVIVHEKSVRGGHYGLLKQPNSRRTLHSRAKQPGPLRHAWAGGGRAGGRGGWLALLCLHSGCRQPKQPAQTRGGSGCVTAGKARSAQRARQVRCAPFRYLSSCWFDAVCACPAHFGTSNNRAEQEHGLTA
jgi:hypothetical protein